MPLMLIVLLPKLLTVVFRPTIINSDFLSCNEPLNYFNQLLTASMSDSISFKVESISETSQDLNNVVSSANKIGVQFLTYLGKSLITIENNKGPNEVP